MLQDPRHRAYVGCAHFPHNLACNSPTLLSNIEIRTLIFRGFQGARQEVLRGIACEIWGGSSAGPTASSGARGHRRGTPSVMRQTADPLRKIRRKTPISSQWVCTLARFPLGTMLTSTRLPRPPRRHDAGPTDRDAHAAAADTTSATRRRSHRPRRARSDCRDHLGDTTPVPPTATRTQRLPTPR